MKLETIKIINSQCREYPEFRTAIYQEFLNCQTIARIEPHESTADLLMKLCKILSTKWVEIYIEWAHWKWEQPWFVTVKFKKGHIKHEKTFTQWRETIHDFEFYVLQELLYFED